MKKKILLVEDDINLGALLKDFLEMKGFSVAVAFDGEKGFQVLQRELYDLYIFDIMLPKKDGITLAKDVRKKDEKTPVIFLTAKSMQQDKIEGLKTGADDYITKPFSSEELLLRINAILRRIDGSEENAEHIYTLGEYTFDYLRRLLSHKKNQQRLTSKESELLFVLCRNLNKTVERSEVLKNVWKEDTYFTSRSMDVYITKLRTYLKNDSSVTIINIHGIGYKLQILE
jgi:DNA-binding response OmpR family regulator